MHLYDNENGLILFNCILRLSMEFKKLFGQNIKKAQVVVCGVNQIFSARICSCDNV